MSLHNAREEIWQNINQEWDVIVIGGGITGAGILREAVRLGLRVLLVEQRDFAWGTSSRSSKMVHGGLRYLAQGNLGLMQTSVQERDQLLKNGSGLITPLGFLMPTYEGDNKALMYHAGLTIYDFMGTQETHRQYNTQEFEMLAPYVSKTNLSGGFSFVDAQTDDARLVLRVINEAVDAGGTALNYVSAKQLIREDEIVTGVTLYDELTDTTADVHARVVINATGAWVDKLRQQVDGVPRIRPLRGSHLVFSSWRFPVAQAINFLHPIDKRAVFAFPWEGVTVVGTTDLDHDGNLQHEPRISAEEVAYLMAGVNIIFPSLQLTLDDVIASYAGVRPVIGTGKADPSKESRDHVVWEEHGLLTVTGGKLTTFRVIAHDALKEICSRLDLKVEQNADISPLNDIDMFLPDKANALSEQLQSRLIGRYGKQASELIDYAKQDELTCITGTQTLWAELRWACHTESVCHLEDLMLRRTRLGLIVRRGGEEHIPRIRSICQAELGWDDAKWEREQSAYLDLWCNHYYLPQNETIPDWRQLIQSAQEKREIRHTQKSKTLRKRRLSLLVTTVGLLFMFLMFRRKSIT